MWGNRKREANVTPPTHIMSSDQEQTGQAELYEEEAEMEEQEDEEEDEEENEEDDTDSDDEYSDEDSDDSSLKYGRRVRRAPRSQGLFPHPLDGPQSYRNAMPYREQYLRAFSAAVREKPNWTGKVLDRQLFAKWVREAQLQDNFSSDHAVLTWMPDDIEFAYRELVDEYKPFVEQMKQSGVPIEPDVDCVWRSDGLIDEELRKQLINAVATLENIAEGEKDWHPGSDKQVLDLVHPSLWPVVYGRSLSAIDRKPIQNPRDKESDWEGFSKRFCWLPSEFEVSADGAETKISSYINNLSSPKQKELFYPILERIFAKFVPLFNHVLGDLKAKKHISKKVTADAGHSYWSENMTKLKVEKHQELWDQVLESFAKSEPIDVDFAAASYPRKDDDEEDDRNDQDTIYYYEVRDMGTLCSVHGMWGPPNISEEFKLEGRTAKVIVKLANIVLTPENPSYAGGSWHVEAMLNERIIATGIYYYAQENITDSKLAFRQTINDIPNVMDVEQYSDWPIVYNMQQDGRGIQRVGSVLTKDNRAIAFPNVYQHRVQPFELADPTKPGYRKILVFFLCDPSESHDIPTTRTVLPQQPEHRDEFIQALREGRMGKMPEDVFRLILEEVPPVITREEAEKYRRVLMKERSSYMQDTAMIPFPFAQVKILKYEIAILVLGLKDYGSNSSVNGQAT
ncbi:hypothetical protein Dda_2063 [Drechslerella dactyloides]|uniref:Uncharacterized protein n=1 Tax=Drechslerella dactyloides TaxID=74499 RepID=A0AAD6NM10_DREDA|nr:hypothetical protein Dda_2063 [Drechslerella dactyloides]